MGSNGVKLTTAKMSFRFQMNYMNPYDIHKAVINEYLLRKSGDTRLLKRDNSRDKTDHDVLKQNHKFLWDDDEKLDTWEQQFAKKYYDKLFKEYCISDLTRYKENKVALRWRTEQEVILGKGQFICGNKKCSERDGLRTWEVNFAYKEDGEKKNALIKIRLCAGCSEKLNYHTKKHEVKRSKHKHIGNKKEENKYESDSIIKHSSVKAGSSRDTTEKDGVQECEQMEESPWDNLKPVEIKSREEEMEDYLHNLLL